MVFRLQQPPWYQDFSDNQMKHLMVLNKAMHMDYEEMVIDRTRRSLTEIGVFSTFFKIPSKSIRKLQRSSKFKTVPFLREIYKILTGNYFENEELKAEYKCNERIILSGIAFLTLPETIVELQKRLPPVIMPKLPPKPSLATIPKIRKRISPYQEELFPGCNWSTYRRQLEEWREKCKIIPIPKVILPVTVNNSPTNSNVQSLNANTIKKEEQRKIIHAERKKTHAKRLTGGSLQIRKNGSNQTSTIIHEIYSSTEDTSFQNIIENKKEITNRESTTHDIPRLPDENKIFEFTLPDFTHKLALVESKMCDIPKPSTQKMKSWLGEKDNHYIISGVSTDLQSCPITYEMSGVANVTRCNSDEIFFTQLNRKSNYKKVYLSGRENLSRKWQEWLQNVDEEFKTIERHMNEIQENVLNTVKVVYPRPVCDDCCSCRQIRKTHLKSKEAKTPYFVIETLATNAGGKRIIPGSMAMHSPGASPSESNEKIEVIPLKNIIIMKPIIHGLHKADNGEIKHLMSNLRQHELYLPSQAIERPQFKTLKAIPPCACNTQKMFNKSITPTASIDEIPWTKSDKLCYGKKCRPEESLAYSCEQYPANKSCRKTSLTEELLKLKKKIVYAKCEEKNVRLTEERKMYSIPDFMSCGDEHGMSLCGARWGTVNIYSPEELAEQERIRLEILKVPPCGNKLGRATCGGPWGTIIPRIKHAIYGKTMEEGEMQEAGIEDDENKEKIANKYKEKQTAEMTKKMRESNKISLAIRQKNVIALKTKKFVPDLSYPGYDDSWNILRTAPSEKDNTVTDYEKSLRLSSPQQKFISVKSIGSSRSIKNKNSQDIEENMIHQSTTVNNLYELRLRGGSQKIKNNEEEIKANKTAENQLSFANPKPYNGIKKKKNHGLEHSRKEKDYGNLRRKQITALSKNMTFPSKTYSYDVDLVVIPEDPPRKCQQSIENRLSDTSFYDTEKDTQEQFITRGPCGWRTKSEQELPVKKNVVYLVEPNYPMEMVSIRAGGRPCVCRENRNKKKTQMYTIHGLSDDKRVGKQASNRLFKKNGKVKTNQQILEGVFYNTPPPSPRKSDEYVPEYELYESPYDKCILQQKDTKLRQIEMYLNPKSIAAKKTSFEGSNQYSYKTRELIKRDQIKCTNQMIKEDLINSQPPEKRWAIALEDTDLTEYFTASQFNVPCWLKCSDYKGYNSSEKRLKMMRPVCECKYERKVIERNEEKVQWKERQRKLKGFRKQTYLSIDNTLRPNEMKKKLIISDAQRIPRDDEYVDEIKYCISNISENYVPAPSEIIFTGINMSSPIATPKASKLNASVNQVHRHWSPINILPSPLPTEKDLLVKNAKFKEKFKVDTADKTYQLNRAQIFKCYCNHDNICSSQAQFVDKNSNLNNVQNLIKNNLRDVNNLMKRKTAFRQRGGGYNKQSEINETSVQNNSNAVESELTVEKEKLQELIKIELQKMCKEDFLFAKLPKCYLMPQLQVWLIYRHGFIVTDAEKQKQIIDSLKEWNKLIVSHRKKIEIPTLGFSKKELRDMTYKRIEEIKRKTKAKKEEFCSQIWQTRVMETRVWWPSMKFFEFRNASFKKTFFTYMANKEAGGHVFKLWKSNEILQQK